MLQRVTTKAIIKKDDKILLLRRSSGKQSIIGKYELPGGKVDFGEDPKLALEREVIEEVGLSLETVQLLSVLSHMDDHDENKQYVIVVYQASLTPVETHIVLSPEHDRYEWKEMSEIQQDEVTGMTKLILGLGQEISVTDKKEQNMEEIEDNITTEKSYYADVIIYTDGGSRGNPGPSASGFVIMTLDEEVIFEGGKYLGITTNNQAEYQAVKLGLEKALEMGVRKVQFRIDSLLVVNQMIGVYRVKNRDLWPIHASIKELVEEFESVSFTHVRREFNKLADAKVNEILDAQTQK